MQGSLIISSNRDSRMEHEEEVDLWQECQLLKRHGQTSCVIRLANTGTIILIGLREPLDIGRAALVSAVHPAPGRVCLKGKLLDDCKIEIDWPSLLSRPTHMPAPVRFQRKQRNPIQRTKRRRLDE